MHLDEKKNGVESEENCVFFATFLEKVHTKHSEENRGPEYFLFLFHSGFIEKYWTLSMIDVYMHKYRLSSFFFRYKKSQKLRNYFTRIFIDEDFKGVFQKCIQKF